MSSKTGRETPSGRPWSLAARLTVWYAGSAFLVLLAASGFLYWALLSNLDREDDEYLVERVRTLRRMVHDDPGDGGGLQRVVAGGSARASAPVSYRIMNAAGAVLLETPGMADELPPSVFPSAVDEDVEPSTGHEVETVSGKSYRLTAARAGGRVVQIAFDRTLEENLLAGYRRNLWLTLAVASILCALLGYRIAKHGLRPVEEITATARRIRSATLNERIAPTGFPAELHTLAATFNEMLDRLEESFARLARFSADIAHELRTPVNNLRGEAEVALGKARSPDEYREVLGSSLEECGRLARLIDSLLFLARAENPQTQIARERIDVGRELAAVRDFYEAAATEAGVYLTVQAPGNLAIDADRALFQRALSNLVANALAHTPSGGSITLRAHLNNGFAHVEVADTGAGIPPEHLPHVFDRFYRADQARTGNSGHVGLGLAIVKSIAALHHGSASIESEPGRGTQVTLTLPMPNEGR
jgi:two-component system heavy metal sensor histidine kinase CusS